MLLTFKRKFPITVPPFNAGTPTQFKLKIQSGEKKHSFRIGHRWKPGMPIHFWEESPRNNGFDPAPFDLPKEMATYWDKDNKGRTMPLCSAVEKWEMAFNLNEEFDGTDFFHFWIGGYAIIEKPQMEIVANNDGLTLAQFVHWFYQAAIGLQVLKMKVEGSWKPRVKREKQPEPWYVYWDDGAETVCITDSPPVVGWDNIFQIPPKPETHPSIVGTSVAAWEAIKDQLIEVDR